MTSVVPEWDLADRMRKALRESDFNSLEMADYLGVNRQTVAAWLGGKHYPKVGMLRLWAMRTGVDFDWLRDGEGAAWAPRGSNPQPTDYWPAGCWPVAA